MNGRWLLYDNVADPYQLTNLARDPAAREVREALEAELQGWMDRFDDPLAPAEALLERMGLTKAWIEREEHFHPPGRATGGPARHPLMQALA